MGVCYVYALAVWHFVIDVRGVIVMIHAYLYAVAVGCGLVIGVVLAVYVLKLIAAICDAVDEGVANAKRQQGRDRDGRWN